MEWKCHRCAVQLCTLRYTLNVKYNLQQLLMNSLLVVVVNLYSSSAPFFVAIKISVYMATPVQSSIHTIHCL
jgi:hypothetical protein